MLDVRLLGVWMDSELGEGERLFVDDVFMKMERKEEGTEKNSAKGGLGCQE